jgi:hypothetical protein
MTPGLTLERWNELWAKYALKRGDWEHWHPTVWEAECDVRELLAEVERLNEELSTSRVESGPDA